MMRSPAPLLALALHLAVPAAALAQPGTQVARGELLYTTHCHTCHSEQMHWRDQKRVTGWASLLAETRRWQQNAGGSWDPGDTEAIACHMNARFYRLPPQAGLCGQ